MLLQGLTLQRIMFSFKKVHIVFISALLQSYIAISVSIMLLSPSVSPARNSIGFS